MAGKFNLADYETVKERKAKFYQKFEDGRIIVEILNPDTVMSHALYRASVYKTVADQFEKCPLATGTALEIRDMERRVSNMGEEYEGVNYTSWSENAEESAVGRALDNAGFSGNKKPSREEMKKVERHSEVLKPKNKVGCSAHQDGKTYTLKAIENKGVAMKDKDGNQVYGHKYKDKDGKWQVCRCSKEDYEATLDPNFEDAVDKAKRELDAKIEAQKLMECIGPEYQGGFISTSDGGE